MNLYILISTRAKTIFLQEKETDGNTKAWSQLSPTKQSYMMISFDPWEDNMK